MSFENKIMKANYHTHMYLCKHATGTVEDYVKKAIDLNLKVIGMSDHAPFDFLKDRSVRMSVSDYPIYLKELEQTIKKYGDKITIYKGLEIEYFSHKENHYEDLLTHLDYLTLGQHYILVGNYLKSIYKVQTLAEMKIYRDTIIEAMSTGYFKFVSHPDIFLFLTHEINEEILKISHEIILAAKKYDVALEINANGIRKGSFIVRGEKRFRYPRNEFWQIAKEVGVKVIISSDAHKPEYLFDEAVLEAYKFATDIGIVVEEELVID